MSDRTHQNLDPKAGGLGSGKIPRSPIGPSEPVIRALSEDDGRALDALLEARVRGMERGPVPAGLGERTEKVCGLLALLEYDTFDGPSADLASRTVSAIRAQEQRKRFAEQVQMLAEPRRTLGVDWRQLATAAAVFILGASLLMPVMERQQADSRRIVGAGRLGQAGQAFARYAADNEGQMPRGNIRPGTVWWEVGQPEAAEGQYVRSNSAHLYKLVRQGYTGIENLTCPENEHALRFSLSDKDFDWKSPQAVSFSYQNQYRAQMLRLEEAPTMAVLADRNPRFEVQGDRIVFNPNTPLDARSRAHRGEGQNVLTADGNVSWRIQPTVDLFGDEQSDNIWSATGVDFYHGTEVPADPLDSFLVP
jgi:hypothetical protein